VDKGLLGAKFDKNDIHVPHRPSVKNDLLTKSRLQIPQQKHRVPFIGPAFQQRIRYKNFPLRDHFFDTDHFFDFDHMLDRYLLFYHDKLLRLGLWKNIEDARPSVDQHRIRQNRANKIGEVQPPIRRSVNDTAVMRKNNLQQTGMHENNWKHRNKHIENETPRWRIAIDLYIFIITPKELAKRDPACVSQQ